MIISAAWEEDVSIIRNQDRRVKQVMEDCVKTAQMRSLPRSFAHRIAIITTWYVAPRN